MENEEVAKVSMYSIALMAMTSIHHIYGALIYNTPWRLHILMISLPMITFSVIWRRLVTQKHSSFKKFIAWSLSAIISIFSIFLIGGYEGVYNHALKNLFFYGGADQSVLQQLFPAPRYVMPDDLIFELTGIFQAVIFFPLVIHFTRWLRTKDQFVKV